MTEFTGEPGGNKTTANITVDVLDRPIKSKRDSSVVPVGVVPQGTETPLERPQPLSIEDMLTWEPSPRLLERYGLNPDKITINPTPHALSIAGTRQERRQVYDGVVNFLADSETVAYIAEEFRVTTKSFEGRPPLRIVAEGKSDITNDQPKHGQLIFRLGTESLFFILENEHGPLASIGFNQFADGVEMRYWQGLGSDKIGDSVKDLPRLGAWDEKLVALVERYAQRQGLNYSMIVPASEQGWVDPVKFPIERARKIYDGMAEKRDYKLNEKLQRHIKTIPPSDKI